MSVNGMSYCSVCPSPSSVSSTLVAVLPRGCAPPLFGRPVSTPASQPRRTQAPCCAAPSLPFPCAPRSAPALPPPPSSAPIPRSVSPWRPRRLVPDPPSSATTAAPRLARPRTWRVTCRLCIRSRASWLVPVQLGPRLNWSLGPLVPGCHRLHRYWIRTLRPLPWAGSSQSGRRRSRTVLPRQSHCGLRGPGRTTPTYPRWSPPLIPTATCPCWRATWRRAGPRRRVRTATSPRSRPTLATKITSPRWCRTLAMTTKSPR
ncbi:hypothetical protein BU14_1145s0001 [Porphyra umbilicalis]|uniref:Uncharacterized protein n=1 Tax=Porphyra umbilicalis TaxID=2786 RepID=A0A1X6NMJ2_PORUM|nr:hypothetical protein BU14_1145s0001 [Porphyra umbilicalis]|eukprot:OSX69792.1 hypothetical protein BU14_1145s0001 [Porphyra umbilicalis]